MQLMLLIGEVVQEASTRAAAMSPAFLTIASPKD